MTERTHYGLLTGKNTLESFPAGFQVQMWSLNVIIVIVIETLPMTYADFDQSEVSVQTGSGHYHPRYGTGKAIGHLHIQCANVTSLA
jgi:hypothetical protein